MLTTSNDSGIVDSANREDAMTKEQAELRMELERVAALAQSVGDYRAKLESAERDLAQAMYEIQQKWGK